MGQIPIRKGRSQELSPAAYQKHQELCPNEFITPCWDWWSLR